MSLRDYPDTGNDSEFLNKPRSIMEILHLVWKIFVNLHFVFRYLGYRIVDWLDPKIREIRLRNFMEMEPDPKNRVILGEERDGYGVPIPVVQLNVTQLDKKSIVVLHEVLKREIEACGFGQLVSDLSLDTDPWPIDQEASHHLGTTRMGHDPRTSVVNPDCQVHSVHNLFIAGGSVFPTSGNANPTFTIVTLAIRLAHHVERLLKDRALLRGWRAAD